MKNRFLKKMFLHNPPAKNPKNKTQRKKKNPKKKKKEKKEPPPQTVKLNKIKNPLLFKFFLIIYPFF